MRSIISNERQCLICGNIYNLHKHHIFYAAGRRPISEKYGCWCYLCARHHNMSSEGVHFNKTLDLRLKQHAQKKFEAVYPDLDFLQIFHKNYL